MIKLIKACLFIFLFSFSISSLSMEDQNNRVLGRNKDNIKAKNILTSLWQLLTNQAVFGLDAVKKILKNENVQLLESPNFASAYPFLDKDINSIDELRLHSTLKNYIKDVKRYLYNYLYFAINKKLSLLIKKGKDLTDEEIKQIISLISSKLIDLNYSVYSEKPFIIEIIESTCEEEHAKELIEKMFDHGANLDIQIQDNFTPLMWAIIQMKEGIALRLIELGVDTEQRNGNGDKALTLANNAALRKIEDSITEKRKNQFFSIFNAQNATMPIQISDSSVQDVIILDNEQNHGFDQARGQKRKHQEIEKDYEIESFIKKNNLRELWYVYTGKQRLTKEAIVSLLKAGWDIVYKSKNFEAACELIYDTNETVDSLRVSEEQKNFVKDIKYLVYDEVIRKLRAEFFHLITKDDISIQQRLRLIDIAGLGILNVASIKTLLMESLGLSDNWVTDFLLNHFVGLNDQDELGRTLLYRLCSVKRHCIRYLQKAEYLIAKGADISITDSLGQTPLHAACAAGNLDMVRLLDKMNAKLNIPDKQGQTPLIIACNKKQEHVAQFLIQRGVDLNAQDFKKNTALIIVCLNKSENIAKMLIEAYANLDIQGQDGKTALMYACYLGLYNIVKLLIQHKAYVEIQDGYRMTALSWAVQNEQIGIVEFLLCHGANQQVKDEYGDTPFDLALKTKNKDLINILSRRWA